MGFKTLACHVGRFMRNHGTSIATGVAIVGYAATIVTAVQETRTFDARIEELRISNNGAELTKKEIATTAVKTYWPTAVIFAISTTSLIMGQRAMYKRLTNLTAAYNTTSAAYAMTDKAFREYKEAVKKTVSEKKQAEIDHEVNKSMAAQVTPEQVKEIQEYTRQHPGQEELYMDKISGRIFYSTPIAIQAGINEANNKYQQDGEICYDDILDAWGVDTHGGSNVTSKLVYRYDIEGELLDFNDDSNITLPDGRHAIVLAPKEDPRFLYS